MKKLYTKNEIIQAAKNQSSEKEGSKEWKQEMEELITDLAPSDRMADITIEKFNKDFKGE